MGAFTSRQNAGVEEVDISGNNAYRYPPKSGCYFGSHFIMGGERFDTTQPESYLFGENTDLNFLGSRPIPFPYPAPQNNEPTKTLRSLINIRKDSLRFVKIPPLEEVAGENDGSDSKPEANSKYNIEFTFDSDVKADITLYYFATEEINSGAISYSPKEPSLKSETYTYKAGAGQVFSETSHVFDPSIYTEEELLYSFEKEVIPIVIQCDTEDKENEPNTKQSHMTFAIVEKSSDGYQLKPLKQKQMVDGMCYLLQEIYGIENKNVEGPKVVQDDDIEDNGSECVICMSDIRDTLILPCRHLCLCNSCADSLRYQANNCPICRAPFRALLQIRALRKKAAAQPNGADPPEENTTPQDNVPPGYEAISLLEALNGPTATMTTSLAPQSPQQIDSVQVVSSIKREQRRSRNEPSCAEDESEEGKCGKKEEKLHDVASAQLRVVLPDEEEELTNDKLQQESADDSSSDGADKINSVTVIVQCNDTNISSDALADIEKVPEEEIKGSCVKDDTKDTGNATESGPPSYVEAVSLPVSVDLMTEGCSSPNHCNKSH